MVAVHIFRWDLDRTYLATDIHSVRGLIRTAFESAGDKRNIPGSAALMRAQRAGGPGARIHVLSGSPTQLRRVLEEKLALDGIAADRMVLKDNLGNLRRGRIAAMRGQVGYKLPALLAERAELPADSRETLFGDDAEVDALIYAAYAAVVAGTLDESGLVRLLRAGEAYPDAIEVARAAVRRITRAPAVEAIFIHLDEQSPLARFADLAVIPVFSWFQAAIVLWSRERITPDGLVDVARSCTAEGRLSEASLAGLLQDAVRRALVPAEVARRMLALDAFAGLRARGERVLDRLGAVPARAAASRIDWVGALARSRGESPAARGSSSRG
jgi:hypothetical protein